MNVYDYHSKCLFYFIYIRKIQADDLSVISLLLKTTCTYHKNIFFFIVIIKVRDLKHLLPSKASLKNNLHIMK